MCGRFAVTLAPEIYRQAFGYQESPNFPPRYNIAPTQPISIVTETAGVRRHQLVRWSFLPSWAKDPKAFPVLINARGETLLDKPAFRHAVKRRRCVMLADGFYEWRREGRTKTPFLVRMADRGPMPLAGLWETWEGPNGEEVDGAAIVTTFANGVVAAIHDRMPLILRGGDLDRWLACTDVTDKEAATLIRPCPESWIDLTQVGSRVNSVAPDDAALQEPAGPPAPPRRSAPRDGGDEAQGVLF
jgi:putative SOS response-associated peptidase YedK